MSSLVAFEAVARHRSFLGASKELALSQSTVSYRIRNLEETIGVQLFLRLTRRVKLTAAGEEFLVYANSALREVANGIDSLLGAISCGLRMICPLSASAATTASTTKLRGSVGRDGVRPQYVIGVAEMPATNDLPHIATAKFASRNAIIVKIRRCPQFYALPDL